MTSKERINATVKGLPTDKVPVYHLQYSGHASSVILGRPDVCVGGGHNQWLEINALWEGEEAHKRFEERCEEDAFAITEATGGDLLRLQYWRWSLNRQPVEKFHDNSFLIEEPTGARTKITFDPHTELITEDRKERVRESGGIPGSPYAVDETALRDEVLRAEKEAETYCGSAEKYLSLESAIRKYPDYLVRSGSGTVSIGLETPKHLIESGLWPELTARRLMAKAKKIIKDLPFLARTGLSVNIAGGDFCSNQGPAISPLAFRDIVLPALSLIVEETHKNGMGYFYTSDGNFWPVAEMMFNDAGVDGWMETDRSAGMDLRALRTRFPRATIQGNIRVQVLHIGSKDEVTREVMDCLEAAHELGGIIIGASNLIMPGTPPENILTMVKLIEENR